MRIRAITLGRCASDGPEIRRPRFTAGKHVFSVGRPATFTQEDAHPSAAEYLLGALGVIS